MCTISKPMHHATSICPNKMAAGSAATSRVSRKAAMLLSLRPRTLRRHDARVLWITLGFVYFVKVMRCVLFIFSHYLTNILTFIICYGIKNYWISNFYTHQNNFLCKFQKKITNYFWLLNKVSIFFPLV